MEAQPTDSSESYSWNRERTSEELQSFISKRLAAIVERAE